MDKLKAQIWELLDEDKKILNKVYVRWLKDHAYLWEEFGLLEGLRYILLTLIRLFYEEHKQLHDISKIEQAQFANAFRELISNPDALLQRGKKAQLKEFEQEGAEIWFKRFYVDVARINAIIGRHEGDPSFFIKNSEPFLPPEVTERIMEKVQDIQADGVAYSTVARNRNYFILIFRQGLLAPSMYGKSKILEEEFELKRGTSNDQFIFFNINGRSGNSAYDHYAPVGIHASWHRKTDDMTVIFDISKYKEIPLPEYKEGVDWRLIKQQLIDGVKRRNFSINYSISASSDINIYDKLGKPTRWLLCRGWKCLNSLLERGYKRENLIIAADDQYGFVLKHRVPPRFFRGIFIKAERRGGFLDIVNLMMESYRQRPDLLLPIYDTDGNLLWPRKMDYWQVKFFASKRDARKKS